jgi:photosystem II stability/assembly factor-like uncharacterized protein
MHKKRIKYILFCLVMVISIVLILNVVRHNSDQENAYNSNHENPYNCGNDNSYNPDYFGGTYPYIDLSFIDKNVGWAVESIGQSSHIVKTADGGESWINVSSYNNHIVKIFFLDPLDGWAITQSNTSNSVEYLFLKTEDGGKTFQVINKQIMNSPSLIQMETTDLKIFDKNNGYVMISGKLLTTTDGGQKWSEINPNTPNLFITKMCFINDHIGWIGGSGPINKDLTLGGGTDAYIYSTTDGGHKWSNRFQVSSTPDYQKKYHYSVNGISFIDNNQGWFLIEEGADMHTELYRTVNGGKTYTVINSNDLYLPGPQQSHMQFLDKDIGFTSYRPGGGIPQGGIFKTNDGGKTFKNASITNSHGNISVSGSILFMTPSIGYAICPGRDDGDIIIKTTDQGDTWKQIFPVAKD